MLPEKTLPRPHIRRGSDHLRPSELLLQLSWASFP